MSYSRWRFEEGSNPKHGKQGMPRTKNTVSSQPLFPEFQDDQAPSAGTISRERLPTNTTTYSHPIHRWFNFIAGFSPEFVHECCESAGIPSQSTILDPFAGCATTLVAASQRGYRSVGFEPHPFFARIAKAKVSLTKAENQLSDIRKVLLDGLRQPKSLALLDEAPRTFLLKLFPGDILESLIGAREALRKNRLDDDLGFLVLSKLVDKCSHSQTDGIYKAPTSRKTACSPESTCDDIIVCMLDDLRATRAWPTAECVVHEQTSENMAPVASSSVSLMVTSPPYLNNFDFAEMTRMYLYFWGMANSWGDITDKVRSRLIVNTTTALKGHKQRQREYREQISPRLRPDLGMLVDELGERRKEKAGKKEYDLLIYPYFAQMSSVLRESQRVLLPGASIHIMVADAALYGVHISAPQFLHAILEDLGFDNVSCSLVRRRGHRWILTKREGSSTGLGEYHIHAQKKA